MEPTCEECSTDLVIVEVRGIYDGGLFFECMACGHRQHRWPEGHYLRARAESYWARFPNHSEPRTA